MEGFISEDWYQLSTSSQFDIGDVTSSHGHPNSPLKKGLTKAVARGASTSNSLFVESLIDQLSRLLESDPKQQRKVYNAICSKLCDLRLIDDSYRWDELATLRGHYRQALATFVQAPGLRAPLLETSRYALEFKELAWIASGGFGQVFRARHRLDQVEYAVKKIKVRYKDASIFLRTLAEVKTLARLNHINIVQYKGAWLEATSCARAEPIIVEESCVDASDGVVFQDSNEEGSDSTSSEARQLALCRYQKPPGQAPQAGALLYVTMQLCDETLRNWLDRRNATCEDAGGEVVDLRLALEIVRQAAAGIAYIHSCNVVHHDIKPSNIFINRDMRVQVGDFGLACTLQGGSCPVGAGQRGTDLYAAPEQLNGHCHQRSDLFSLGLVLLELLSSFTTAMERVAVLKKARGGEMPPKLPGTLQDLIGGLTEPRPDLRPTADTLLEQLNELRQLAEDTAVEAKQDKKEPITDCAHDLVEDKDAVIRELRGLLAARDAEITELKARLGSII